MKYSKELHEKLRAGYCGINYVQCLLDEIDRLNAERRWIPVSERLPEDNIEVLIFDGTDIFLACHQSRVPQWSGDGAYYHGGWYYMITHWMPLPEPPESEG